ncbi:ABC transporter permease [Streptomyces lunaelactis]|uniref:FtsX-like permease family protein n=1 Tax=Streptomyces lunaelactis TaxID=1535768 RepID=UPI00158475EC|nr:FtsX-like permease family protein [Streptomyces lunaelactis]NUK10030.1 ABC transporter permease [Streptomyces lunaelactis]
MRSRTVAAVAPWVRTRLRTAPGTACALALLVALTAFLAALFPRGVEAYETAGLRHDIRSAAARSSVLEVTGPPPGLEKPQAAREKQMRADSLTSSYRGILERLPEPVRADTAESSYGVRTTVAVAVDDPWLARPTRALPPKFRMAAQAELDRHATLRAGRLPVAREAVTSQTAQVEAAVTAQTAESLRIKVGSVLHVPGQTRGPLAVRITGIVEPLRPHGGYWSTEPLLRTPALEAEPGGDPLERYWLAALLLPPDAAPVLLGVKGEPEYYWRIAPDPGRLTASDADPLKDRIASLSGGPGLLSLRAAAGTNAAFRTDLETVLGSYASMRSAITPVVAVAAFGIGAVAAVVLAMAGGLVAARRRAELGLLRSRGGSLRGIGGRLFAETAVVAVPASALGLLAARLAVPDGRLLPSLAGAAAVALLACAALPVRAVVLHRRPQAYGGRDDLVESRPSRRRTVAELTLLVLAVGAVTALRRRGTGSGSTDFLVSSAPVLVGLIAALLLVRLHPLPLRWASRAAGRLRGAVGFLSLARAGRSSATGALPLLAVLVALTTASFGGSVLAGVSDARERAALLTTGADARVTAPATSLGLPAGAIEAVHGAEGVREVAPVHFADRVSLPNGDRDPAEAKGVRLVGVDPGSYARLTERTGLGALRAGELACAKRCAGPLPVVASLAVAARLGSGPRRIESPAGDVPVRVVAVRDITPAVPSGDFLLVDSAGLSRAPTTELLVTGSSVDGARLRAAVDAAGKDIAVTLRTEVRAAFVDSPMQEGAERIYGAAIAAGAGYAVLALLLSVLGTAPERATLLARLRTMGLTTRQGRQLLGLEALPQALPAAVGGALVGWATIVLLAPGIDLVRLALAAAPGFAVVDGAPLRADPWSLGLPAAGVIVLAGAVAAAQAWWAGRRGSVHELKAGDAR